METLAHIPHHLASASTLFGIAGNMQVPVLEVEDALGGHIPEAEPEYHFDTATTQAVLAGFMHRMNVLIQGFHGTGKSTHIEQIAARLRWPLVRVNLDGHVTRSDLIGRDAIVLRDGKQVTEFVEGMLPWALSRPCALLFDEYDAARPDVMFVLQRILEASGKLTLLDQNRVLTPHAGFRLFATANTLGMGDMTGLYHGTNPINQGQMDRWQIVARLNYLPPEDELRIVRTHVKAVDDGLLSHMIAMANLLRQAFAHQDVSTVMSPRGIINWAKNVEIFEDIERAFAYAHLNRCDESEHGVIAELYQRVFNKELLTVAE